MSLEKIVNLVRREDVVLWIGSGFSLYAGFPTGASLAKLIYNALSEEEKECIIPGSSLLDLAEQFVRLKGDSRNELNQVLRKEFMKRPNSLKWHQLLVKIPHIKTIITTNYDQLLEKAYGNDMTTVISESDLAYLDGKTELFKVHGDILRPDSIILTRTDYTDIFLHNIPNNLLWTTIKARLANKTLVFVGYDMEDENVKVMLQKLNQALGTNRKEIFLIAPGFRNHKVQYLSKFNIQYVDSKGEIFLEKLLLSIKENIVTDHDRRLVSTDTFRKFCQLHNLSIELASKKNGFDLKGIAAVGASFASQVSFNLKNNADTASLTNILSGKKFGEITLDKDAMEGLKIFLNDVNILSDDSTYKLILTSPPAKQGRISVTFDDRTEFDNIDFQIFRSKALIEIKAAYAESNYSFQINPADLRNGNSSSTFIFTAPETFKNVNQATQSFMLALKIGKAIGFTIYPEGDTKSYHFRMSQSDFALPAVESNLTFFESLKKIERAYGVRFQNIGGYSRDDFNNAMKIAAFANGGSYFQVWPDKLEFEIDEDTPLELLQKMEEGATLTAVSQVKEVLMIYDQSIELGYQVIEGSDLYIANRMEIDKGETNVALVRSKSQKVRFYYRPDLP